MGDEIAVMAVDQARPLASRAAGVVLTVLLTLALAASILVAVAVTLLYVGLGWPRLALVSVISVLVVGSWAPLLVTAVVAGRHEQAWWTPARLGAATLAVAATTGAVLWLMYVGLAHG